eukprot:scaffold56308_cov61-Phaeocystis_antarctica.AAC.11
MIEPRLWSMLVLAGLAASLPFVVSCTAIVALLQRLFGDAPEKAPSNGKTAIVSGGKMTKSFVLTKQLKAQGCRVVLVETNKYWMVASRFSNCVDRFVTVPVPENSRRRSPRITWPSWCAWPSPLSPFPAAPTLAPSL